MNKVEKCNGKEIDMNHVRLIINRNPKEMAIMYIHANGYASNLVEAEKLYDRVNGEVIDGRK